MKTKSKLIPITGLLVSATTITPFMVSCNKKPEYVEEEDLSPGKSYTPSIQPTTEKFDPTKPEDTKKINEAYFKNEKAPTIVKEDVCGYLKPYIDDLGSLKEAREWLAKELPIISAIVERILDNLGISDLGDLTKTIVDITKPTIVSTEASNATVSPSKMTSTINLSAKAELINSGSKYGDIELNAKIEIKNLPYTIYYSNSGKWMCGTGNTNLKNYNDWSIGLNITGNTIIDGTTTPIDPVTKSWISVPTEEEAKKEFEQVRSLLQWNSAYLKNSN